MTRAAVAALVVAAALAGCGADAPPPAASATVPATEPVRRGALASVVALNGTLTYRAPAAAAVVNQAAGIYTALPAIGRRVGCGEVLYRVDDAPVLLLCGTVPAYRALKLGADGRDVRQLNRALRSRGARGGPTFTWRTREALEDLQRDLGVAADGTLAAADVVFLPRAVRVASVSGVVGGLARPGAKVLDTTTGALEVQVELAPAQQGEVRVGDRARIALPGNRTAAGRVTRVGRVARTATKDDPAATATIPAAIALDRPRVAAGLDRAPVRVEVRTKGVADVLSVPLLALVGRAGGGFAVEVVRGGSATLVAVELGLVDTTAGLVEVTGALRAGDRVVVPAP